MSPWATSRRGGACPSEPQTEVTGSGGVLCFNSSSLNRRGWLRAFGRLCCFGRDFQTEPA